MKLESRRFCEELHESVSAWSKGRFWWWRAPLLAWFAYMGVRHLADAEYTSLFGGINLGVHEMGHIVFGWAPMFIAVAAGTLFQLVAPIVSGYLFLRQPDYFALPVCGAWLSTNLYYVAAYMADARALKLPLVTIGPEGGEVEHDWNYMLSALGLLDWDTRLAVLVRFLAFLWMWGSIAAGVWVLAVMAKVNRR